MKEKWTKKAYIAGPYRAKSEWGVRQNILAAEGLAVKLWYYGWVAVCPHMNTAFFGGAYNIPDDVWLKGDLLIMKDCDIVVVLPGWEYSSGTLSEIEKAKELGIPVYFWTKESDRIFLISYYEEEV